MKTIDVTPKWEGMMKLIIAVLENPKASIESKQAMREELVDLGKWVDEVNEERKKQNAQQKRLNKVIDIAKNQAETAMDVHRQEASARSLVFKRRAWLYTQCMVAS